MPDLPKKKVGIVACSGEERPEGSITRLAALRVLEQLRPDDTVTICLPLFLAGGEGDRAFAHFYPTIALDGCDKRCAARATERYSGKPATSLVVTDWLEPKAGFVPPTDAGLGTAHHLSAGGRLVVKAVAEEVAAAVDTLLPGGPKPDAESAAADETLPTAGEADCACGGNLPTMAISIDGRQETVVGLPLILEKFDQEGMGPDDPKIGEWLLDVVRIYNPVPPEDHDAYRAALIRAYREFYGNKEA